MAIDNTPITPDQPTLSGTWWKWPPYSLTEGEYKPYLGEGRASVSVKETFIIPHDSPPRGWGHPEFEQAMDIEVPEDMPGGRFKEYEPGEKQQEILEALLDVAQGHATPVSFCDRFGLLGYNYFVPDENKCPGDPRGWFMAHANTVYVAGMLIGLLAQRNSAAGRKALATYIDGKLPHVPYAFGGQVVEIPLRLTKKVVPNPWRTPEELQRSLTNCVQRAEGILRWLLNENLGESRRKIGQGFRTFFEFRALIQVVYGALADRIGGRSICQCRECGRIFVSRNPKTRFCQPQGRQTISRCKGRFHVREMRKRQKRSKRR